MSGANNSERFSKTERFGVGKLFKVPPRCCQRRAHAPEHEFRGAEILGQHGHRASQGGSDGPCAAGLGGRGQAGL